MHQVKIAINAGFLTAFSKIPKKQQKKVREFIEKFTANPRARSINYEKIQGMRDPNIRTVRIDQEYRAVIVHPEQGNIYMLVWVDHHNEAMAWAKEKVFSINKYTGAIEIIDHQKIAILKNEKKKKPQDTLFADVKDKYLLRCGVPKVLLPTIKAIKSEHELDSLVDYLPQEAAEALYMFASGYSYDEVYREMQVDEQPQEVSTEDFEAALDNQQTKRRFYVVQNDEEVTKMLNAPLDLWRVFLHPSQNKFAQMNASGSVKILGGAGTGKTVVAMHRAKHLAEKVFTNKEDCILFTTFSRNLVIDVENNLQAICSSDAMKRIEVININAWVSNFLKKQGFPCEVVSQENSKKYWENAMNVIEDTEFDDVFFKDEWEQVIQPNAVGTAMDYMRVSRIGRGRSIPRSTRKKIWPVFEEYRSLLNESGQKEFTDLVRDARELLQQQGHILPYKAVIVDEGQDMGTEVYKLIRTMLPEGKNDIFIVGDGHQGIYKRKVVLSHCGIKVRGRSHKLKLNYRTTEEIKRWAVALLEGKEISDLDGSTDDQKGYMSLLHGEKPIVQHFSSYDEEFAYIKNYIAELEKQEVPLHSICLVARTNDLIDKRYAESFKKAGIKTYTISRRKTDSQKQKGVRLATMHRVKGLEFNFVIIASVNKDAIPLKYDIANKDNPTAKQEAEIIERSLLYVAATRAKREVLITSYGNASSFLL